jgi:HD-like signal output (HDOD) protein
MVLSDEVKDVKGRLLLKKGQIIESNHIRILKMWGVTEVNVVGDASCEEDTETEIDQALLEKVTEDTRRDFVHVDLDHPANSELFRLSVLYRSAQGKLKKEQITGPDEYKDAASQAKPDVRKKIKQDEVKLPEIPSIVFELNEIMADPLSSADDIAQIVSKSPSLATVLLKIVNSSFYGFPSKIDSISRAVTMIGTREIGSLAVGISVITLFDGIPKTLIDMHGFLRHGFACGIISRILAAQKSLPQTEQLFVSGLLHDIGRAIVYQYFPQHANMLLCRSLESGKLLYQEETACLGCKHTEIGSHLLKKWKLPFSLENNISCHHNPSTADDPVQAVIVQMADIISNALELGTSGERFVPNLDYKAWDGLGLSPSCFDVVIRQGINQLTVFEHFLQQKGE